MAHILAAPPAGGAVTMLVIRPGVDERVQVTEAIVDPEVGILGDTWRSRGNARTPDGLANPDDQVTIMNSRVAMLMAGSEERMPLAGDQIYADLDVGTENLPTGTQVRIGDAILQITDLPHTGCSKFTARFGAAALRLTATEQGRALRLRGVNARVLRRGTIKVGDTITVERP